MPFLYILRVVVRNLNFNLAISRTRVFSGRSVATLASKNKQAKVEERGEWAFSDSERKIEIWTIFLCLQSCAQTVPIIESTWTG
jgi:hypothetical protein